MRLTGAVVQRAVLLDPEAPPALRRCVEQAAAALGKLQMGPGPLQTLALRFPVRL